ncbi:MAG TPA: hypothetical protein VLB83_04405 [Candidatus Paceibacterota bacterium]|nr:hypothetical protein [Candidatus Paceibacterota bacterium]
MAEKPKIDPNSNADIVGLAVTREQFKTLLKAVYLANWIANGRRDDEDMLLEFDALEQYIFSRAKDAGFPDAVYRHKTDEGVEHFHPSRAFEFDRELDRIVKRYDDLTFWDELSERFAERDMERMYGADVKSKMDPQGYQRELDDLVAHYDEESELHGIDRYKIPE